MHWSSIAACGLTLPLLLLSNESNAANSIGSTSSISTEATHTAGEQNYFSKLAERPRLVKRIKVVVEAPLPMHDPAGYDEAVLTEYGCTYSTEDPAQVASVLRILSNENAKVAKRRGFLPNDFYGAVYIDMVKVRQEKILYGYHGYSRVDAVINDQKAEANASVAKDLAKWASEFSGKGDCRPATGHPFSLKQFN